MRDICVPVLDPASLACLAAASAAACAAEPPEEMAVQDDDDDDDDGNGDVNDDGDGNDNFDRGGLFELAAVPTPQREALRLALDVFEVS